MKLKLASLVLLVGLAVIAGGKWIKKETARAEFKAKSMAAVISVSRDLSREGLYLVKTPDGKMVYRKGRKRL